MYKRYCFYYVRLFNVLPMYPSTTELFILQQKKCKEELGCDFLRGGGSPQPCTKRQRAKKSKMKLYKPCIQSNTSKDIKIIVSRHNKLDSKPRLISSFLRPSEQALWGPVYHLDPAEQGEPAEEAEGAANVADHVDRSRSSGVGDLKFKWIVAINILRVNAGIERYVKS